MKTHLLAILVGLVAVCALGLVGAGCTGFAVHSEPVLFGMNFDCPPNEIRFWIEEHEAGAVFLGGFRMGSSYAYTVGMNEYGLFSSDQMVYPARATVGAPPEDELYIWDAFYDALRRCDSVDSVLAWIGGRRLVQYSSPLLRNLYADPTGNAIVAECGVTENVITAIDGPFLVMTNFHNGDFAELSPADVAGSGADRYRIAHRYIAENLDAFDLDHAFETLRRVALSTGDYKTRFSLVLDPAALAVYIALERDYDHIWKASLVERTIETYRGFAEHRVLPLDASGVSGPTLQASAAQTSARGFAVTEDDEAPRWPLLAMVAGGILTVTLLAVARR